MNITLRKVNDDDIKHLNEIRKSESPELHKERLMEQSKGKSLYLIAFRENKPVGHIYIKLEGSEKYHDSPVIQDLLVSEDVRDQKIGTMIMFQAEKHLRDLGYEKISLDVETENEWIKKFYENQGFKKKSGPHSQSWIEKDSGDEIKIDVFYFDKKIK